jgi:GntR family transcriptional regulator, transcriptional repressor for pyruvate dehydrogenase complex
MNLARTMTLYFQLAGATYDELLVAWRMLEPIAAE